MDDGFVFWKVGEKITVCGSHNNNKHPQNIFFLHDIILNKSLLHIIVPRYMLKVFFMCYM